MRVELGLSQRRHGAGTEPPRLIEWPMFSDVAFW